MIIETSCNHFYNVKELNDPALAHVWAGYPVKRTKAGFVFTTKGLRMAEVGKFELVRKAATRVVEA